MNYLESSEYKDAKKQLKDEYKITFDKIETYLQLASIYGLQQESCLIQVLDDFLSAQAEGKQLVTVTGPDFKKYCEIMIKAEKGRNKNKLEIISMFISLPLTVMVLSLIETYLPNDHNVGNLTDSITISAFSLSFPVLFLIYYIIKWRTAKALFNHAKASRVITTLVSLIFFGFAYQLSKILDNILNIAIPVPTPLFIIVFTLTFSIFVVIVIMEKRVSKQLKIMPERMPESEEFKIQQITCPMCGKEYDMDYPKCPYCKNKRQLP